MELKGKTIGIMGLGAIGKVTARCAKGFEMNVIAYDPFINEPTAPNTISAYALLMNSCSRRMSSPFTCPSWIQPDI